MKLIHTLLLGLALVCECPALGILHTTHASVLSTNSATLVFSSNPTAGNLLVVFLGTPPRGVISAPAGWTKLDSGVSPWGNAELYSFYHLVGASETNSYTFTSTAAQDQWEFVGYEVTGQASTSYINQHGMATAVAPSLTTPSKTPTVPGTLAVAGLSANSTGGVLVSVSPGWTNDTSENSTYHPTWGASRDALISGTTTPVANTFTINTSDNLLAAVVFIAPARNSDYVPANIY
jgi:hypothetical protein